MLDVMIGPQRSANEGGDNVRWQRCESAALMVAKAAPGSRLYARSVGGQVVGLVRLCAGKSVLLDDAILALNHGRNYGLVGRNGVGKTTLLRSLAEGIIALPAHVHVVHVEQEIPGDERSAIQTVLAGDAEREWLLKVEGMLVEGDEETEKKMRIGLNEARGGERRREEARGGERK